YTVAETPLASDSHLGQTSTTPVAVVPPASIAAVFNIVLITGSASSTDNFFDTAIISIGGATYLVPNSTTASSLTTSSTGVGLAGTTLTLTGTDVFGITVSLTTTTNASGRYSFPGVNPSDGNGYTITE